MSRWPGIAAAASVAVLTLGTLLAVLGRAEAIGSLEPSDWAAMRFTVSQALLSALISVILAIPVARALARRQFRGRRLLVTFLGAPFVLPVIVAVFGLLEVFGRNGIISVAFGWIGLQPIQIFGFHGVVLAHVFFNLPLATRLILHGWHRIPAEHFRLSAQIGFSTQDVGYVLERPMLRQVLPGAFMVIFIICTTSFAVALTLGGGPKATTVELAIYQAFRFEFDLGKAALLAMVQFGICATASVVMLLVQMPQVASAGLDRQIQRWDLGGRLGALQDGIWVGLASLFLLLPLSMIVLRGIGGVTQLPDIIFTSAMRSVLVAVVSAAISVAMAYAIAVSVNSLRGAAAKITEVVGYLAIAASPLVVGTGLFILFFPIVDPHKLALPVTALVNATMALPFGLRVLVPAVAEVEKSFGRLADGIGLTGWRRLTILHVPRLRRPLGFAAGLAAALSMGDLGVIALFADPETATLPLQMYRLMGAYQMEAASGAALLLLALSLTVFWFFDRGGCSDADT